MSTFRTTSTRVIAANVNNTQHPESAVHSGGPKILKLCIQNTPKEKREKLTQRFWFAYPFQKSSWSQGRKEGWVLYSVRSMRKPWPWTGLTKTHGPREWMTDCPLSCHRGNNAVHSEGFYANFPYNIIKTFSKEF